MIRETFTINWIKWFAFLSVAVLIFVALPRAAYAQNFTPTQVGSNTDALGVGGIGASTGLVDTDPRIIAAKIIRIALGLLGIIVIGFMLYAGYLWMTAGGDEEKVATAKKVLRNAVIGLAIILSSVAITQFIISKLTGAIMGATQKQAGGGVCAGDECFKPEFSVFYAITTPQSPPQLPIKNVVVSIDFFNGLGAPAIIDPATISSDAGKTILDNAITIVKQGTVDAKGVVALLPAGASSNSFKGELAFVDQNTVEFHPVGSCADTDNPANSSTNTDCFEKNTVYQITLKNSITSKSGKALDCGSLHPCVSQFITGEKYDAEPPKISLVQPGNNTLVGNGISTLVSAEVSDDAGVKKVAFYENETKNIVDKILNPFLVSGLISDQTWKPKLSDSNKAEVVQLTAKAYDIDNHQTISTPQTVKILPAWCFNNTLDEDKGEEKASTIIGAPDCGQKSECGACQGQGCDSDIECAAGICIPQPGVKVALTDQNTKYKAEGSGLPPATQVIPYYEWYIDSEPLTVAYLPFDKTGDTSKFTSNLSVPSEALNASQVVHATVAGPVWNATEGAIHGAYKFQKPGDYIETSVLPWKGNQLSVQWWMKRESSIKPKLFMIAQIKDSLSIQTNASGNVTVSVNASDEPNASIQEQGAWLLPPSDNKWHQVTVIIDGSAIRYYIDGAQDKESIPFAHIIKSTENSFVIGSKGNKGTISFDGWIDEVRMFSRALNSQQLQAEFKSTRDIQMPSDTLDVNIAPAKAVVTADAWTLSKASYEITNTKAPYREKAGICVNVPKITNVIQTSGAEDNYVTVIGQSFGAFKQGKSLVAFSKVPSPKPSKVDQWINADLCSVKAWHDNYVVVKVPKGALTGPIKIESQSSTLSGYENLAFRDTTADAFGPSFDPAEVFKITKEKLPGLCTIEPDKVSAGDKMTLTGTQLGDGTSEGDAILLGIEDEPLNEFKAWSNFLISDINTPVTVVQGATSIKASVNGKKSNALPLGILSNVEDTNPHIFNIEPAKGPIGTYVTITGKNFGTGGEVAFSQSGDSFVADLPPAYCGVTWKQNQIVVKVPQKIFQKTGDYGVVVTIKKGTADAASNKKIFAVNADPLKPGLCRIEPDNGPLFSAQFGGVVFKGEGFGDALGSVMFTKNAQMSDPKFFAWGDTLIDVHKFSDIDKPAQAKFKTGPVSAANAQNFGSNALQFKIQNCKEELQKGKELSVVCGEGNSCCASGVCEQNGQCPEDKKPGASVYMWSFTTGKLPVVPKVLEQCGKFCSESGKPCQTTAAEDAAKAKKECDKNNLNDICSLVTPSPSPSVRWDNPAGICVNAVVKVRFDTTVDIEEKNAPQKVILYTCQDAKKCVLDDSKQIVGVSYTFGKWASAGNTGTMVTLDPTSDLDFPEKIYGVLVTTQVKSNAGALSEAMPENFTCPVIAPNVTINGVKGIKAAYCTTFVTRATKDYCELGSVVVDPTSATVFDFNKKSDNFYSATPIAKGNVCIALSGDDYNWAWSPSNTPSSAFQKTSDYADISNHPGVKGFIKIQQDLTTKDKETPFEKPEQIIATWIDKTLNPAGLIKGVAQLTIKLPNPKVVSFWPQCTTACVNAEVGADFNVALAPATVNKNTVKLYKCALFDITCKQYVDIDGEVILNTNEADPEKTSRKVVIGHHQLGQDTYYKVKIQGGDSGVKSVWQIQLDSSTLNDDCDNQGKNCTSYSWIFRTKNDGSACAVNKVALNPEIAIVKVVGEQATYSALAIGSPDACNPNGQILDTSGSEYAWSWDPQENPDLSADPNTNRAVVWVSSFASGNQAVQWCTSSCVLAGSAGAPETGICGNNKVESGEECDPSVGDGENTADKCGWNCLLLEPKSKGTPVCNANTVANGSCCGNGPGVLPEAGEECDLGFLNGVPGSGCTEVCLKEGTPVSYAICIDPQKVHGTQDECAQGKILSKKISHVQSVCGNGFKESGESCDKGAQNGAKDSNCSQSCLLKIVLSSLCGNGSVEEENGEECDPKDSITSKGCSDICQKLGSSPLYGSLCGDSVVGAGESCDTAPMIASYIDSIQYATAVGMGTVKEKKQTATVSAAISQVGQPNKQGTGQFELQCGFTPANGLCPNQNPENQVNGVGADSCCYPRPTITIDQPKDNSSGVCPNAVFQITMKGGEADKETLPNNIILAEQIFDDGKSLNCPNGTTPFAYETKTVTSQNWWQKILSRIKRVLGLPAYAENYKYCGGNAVISASSTYDQKTQTSIITVTPQVPLKQKTTYKLLVLNYDKTKGWSGLKDTHGITFVDETKLPTTISSAFTTANVPFCKVTDVNITPDYHLFNKKDDFKLFGATANYAAPGLGVDGIQKIAPIKGQYEWSYVWNISDPSIISLSDIFFPEAKNAHAVGKNGAAIITGGIEITKDTSLPSTVGQEITGEAVAQVFLCENSWPNGTEYKDAKTGKAYGLGLIDADTTPQGIAQMGKAWNNFQTLYCMDAGKQGTADDLSELKLPAVLYHQDAGNLNDPILKEFFFTFAGTSTNADSIGLRVYPNINHKTLSEWYQSQPWIPKGNPLPVKIGSYEALQEGRTYYIAGLNINSTTAYTNVYVWSFSDNASADTVNIFNQLLTNFTLNINIDNPRVCATDSSISCSKDLDCAKAGGICNAPLDKAVRDLKRMKDLTTLANKIELSKILNTTYPNLKNNPSLGTFIPGYTNSRWLSWQGVLGNALNIALPSDPINQFNGCGGDGTVGVAPQTTPLKDFDAQTCWDAQKSTFVCPKGSYVYQYEFTSNTKAVVKADFEWPNLIWNKSLKDSVGNKSVLNIGGGVNSICNDQVIGLSEKCGDGVVGQGEDCEVGQVKESACVPLLASTNNYSGKSFTPCTDTCKWSTDALPLSKLKLCTNNSNADEPVQCVKDTDCGAVVVTQPQKSACASVLNFCKVSGKLCLTTKDCNKADVTDKCTAVKSGTEGQTCVPTGYCGNGKIDEAPIGQTTEICDEGANNGKYGHCSFDCKKPGGGTGGTGYCGDGKLTLNASNEPADPNKVCDASALRWGSIPGIGTGWGYDTSFTVTHGWNTGDNLSFCDEIDNPAFCLWKGAKYNTHKLQSCAWDCQSYDYCGDGKVNSTLKDDGKPYEECEKSEFCQVGYCTYKNGSKFMKNKASVLCEKDTDCAPVVLKIAQPFCDNNSKCSTYSSNAGEACKENKDCVQEFTCQGFVSGKRYCSAPGENTPKDAGNNFYIDDTSKYHEANKECQWVSGVYTQNKSITCLPTQSIAETVAVKCGDGIIQDGKKGADGKLLAGHGDAPDANSGIPQEVCDQGAKNGVIPVAEYGKTANYCAFGCGQVVTVSGGFCGDKNVSQPEYCDASASASDYVCTGTDDDCNPKDKSACNNKQTDCVPSARWSTNSISSCAEPAVPKGSFLTNCTNTCVGSCKVPSCGDKVIDPGEKCDYGSLATGGNNGVIPQLAYDKNEIKKDYCTAQCTLATVTNMFCGDGQLTISQEKCDGKLFGKAAGDSCSEGKLSNCKDSCQAYSCKADGVSDVEITVQVLDFLGTGKYSSTGDGGKEFMLYWNDSSMKGSSIATLNASNSYKTTLSQLTGGNLGTLTIKYIKGSGQGEVQVKITSGFPGTSSIISSSNNPNWSGGFIDAFTQNILFVQVNAYVNISDIKL